MRSGLAILDATFGHGNLTHVQAGEGVGTQAARSPQSCHGRSRMR